MNLFWWRKQNESDEPLIVRCMRRSPRWPSLRAGWLSDNPRCAVCGSTSDCVPHHIVPVHVNPYLELDRANLITLCEGKEVNCHLLFGHLRYWSSWNPSVAADSAEWRRKMVKRP